MIIEKGFSNHYLRINLTEKSWSVKKLTERELKEYIGGKGVGLKLYHDHFKDLAAVDPLGEENLLCFLMSPLLATGAPCSARFDGVTKSPLTGIMVSASCGGPFGYACKTAGWDGILIEGRSEDQIMLSIHYEGVEFIDAKHLWGMGTVQTQEVLGMSPRDAALVIGPAGENLVPYANICSGHRFLGRGGMGAVMGSKNLKAIVARGRSYRVTPANERQFNRISKRTRRYIERSKFLQKYRKYGTNVNIKMGMEKNFAPVDNFRRQTDKRIEHMTGELQQDRYRYRFSACRHCSILCGHKGYYPDGKLRQIPEYETSGMFGSNIGNYNSDIIGQWNDQLNDLGLDSISTGGTIAWAMEATEQGIFKSDLSFGSPENITETIESIALRQGIGEELALGSHALSKKYGGTEYACHVKGMEMAAYDPRGSWGQGLSYAVNNRGGCHLGSYLIGPEAMFGFLDPHSTRSKAQWACFFENIFTVINSLQTCQFMSFAVLLEPLIPKITPLPILSFVMSYFPKLAIALLDWGILSGLFSSVTGLDMSQKEFYEAGERIQVLERWMNTRMGITSEDDTLPGRFLESRFEDGETIPGVDLEPMVKEYYELRGYDEKGIPKNSTLERLGINPYAQQ